MGETAAVPSIAMIESFFYVGEQWGISSIVYVQCTAGRG